MQDVSNLLSLLPGNNFLKSPSSPSLTSVQWGTGKPAGHLAGGQEGQGRATSFCFDVTLCYSWVIGHSLLWCSLVLVLWDFRIMGLPCISFSGGCVAESSTKVPFPATSRFSFIFLEEWKKWKLLFRLEFHNNFFSATFAGQTSQTLRGGRYHVEAFLRE